MHSLRGRFRAALGAVALSALCGCMTYPQRMASVKMDLSRNVANTNAFPTYSAKDELLGLQEKGRYGQLIDDRELSFENYRKAIEFYEKQDEKAIIDLSDSARMGLASTYGNDLSIPYTGSDLERVLCYQNAALSALSLGRMDDAKIGVRNLSDWLSRYLQRSFAEDTASLLAESEGENEALLQRREQSLQVYRNTLQGPYATSVRALKNPVSNAASFALVGLFFETDGKYTDAARAYAQAAALTGNDEGFRSLAKEMLRRDGLLQDGGSADEVKTTKQGEVVVFFENGYAPEKKEMRIALPTAFGAVTASFPYYNPMYMQPATATISPTDSMAPIATTREICDLQAHILRDFEDKKSGIFARQILRTVIKAVTTGVLMEASQQNSNSDAAGLLALAALTSQVAAIASEQADLRSWLLLPASYGYARFTLPAGTHQLRVAAGMLSTTVEVQVFEGGITLLHGISIPGRLWVLPVWMKK